MSILALGTFDGVHIAHKELLKIAKQQGEHVIACTFDVPPAAVFKNDFKLLTTLREKEFLLKKSGADEVFVQRFDKRFAETLPEDYIKALCERFKPEKIICGYNHTFGKNASGNFGVLCELSKKYNFKTVTVPPIKYENEIVSSTLIRQMLLMGEVENAQKMLGRAYSVCGEIVHGRHIGESLGFPTANVRVEDGKLIPKPAVYASFVELDGIRYRSMTNIGVNPTVTDENKLSVETHVFNYAGDMYNKRVRVSFLKKIRDEKRFDSVEELKEQLLNDALVVNAYIDALVRARSLKK